MRHASAYWSLLLVVAGVTAHYGDPIETRPAPNAAARGVAYFEPPKSIGTPLDEVARSYTGYGLAARIEGRIRLDTDASLHPMMREMIRRRLAQAQ